MPSLPKPAPENFRHPAARGWFHCPIGGGVAIASPSRKPALSCRAGPVSPQHGRQRTSPTRFLGGSFSGIARLSKGETGFLAGERDTSRLGRNNKQLSNHEPKPTGPGKLSAELSNPLNHYLHLHAFLPASGAYAANGRSPCEVFGHSQSAVITLHQRFVGGIHP